MRDGMLQSKTFQHSNLLAAGRKAKLYLTRNSLQYTICIQCLSRSRHEALDIRLKVQHVKRELTCVATRGASCVSWKIVSLSSSSPECRSDGRWGQAVIHPR